MIIIKVHSDLFNKRKLWWESERLGYLFHLRLFIVFEDIYMDLFFLKYIIWERSGNL